MHSLRYLVPSWLHHHHLGGRTILPAVECMRLLAAAYGNLHPGHKFNCVLQARFLRLIEVAAGAGELEFFLEVAPEADRELLILWRRLELKGMKRMLRCAELVFVEEAAAERSGLPAQPESVEQSLDAERIYRDLVPFGPAFQSLSGAVWLAGPEAGGEVLAPELADTAGDDGAEIRGRLGSPFPLDGAMHLACVHGQRRVDFVPFPVVMARRRLYQPTRPGRSYQVRARLQRQEADMLVYDLWLTSGNKLYEEVQSLVMRDVSGGRMRPPAWWRSG